MKVINFELKYFDKFLAFSKKNWPQKSEEYLRYRLFQFPEKVDDNSNNMLVINENGDILGCNLFFPTSARIKDNVEKVLWSHDTLVEEENRGDAGLLLFSEMIKIKSIFGLGLSERNFKIQKLLKANFIGVAYQYLIINVFFLKFILAKLRLIGTTTQHEYNFPNEIRIGAYSFKKISNVNELRIPKNGFWSDDSIDVDFVRDNHFLKTRFFENFRKYFFYKLELSDGTKPDECYFVVRPTIEGGITVLSLVDFRFNLKIPRQYRLILKACSLIGRKNKLPLVTVKTSLKFKKLNLFPLVYRMESKTYIITYFPITCSVKVLVTKADSDIDFLTD